jgi:hypothetical protein
MEGIHQLQPNSDTKLSEQPHEPSFLDGLQLEHGPVPDLARFLLRADAAVRERGVSLSFVPISEIVRVNAENPKSWGAFTPILDTRIARLAPDRSFCLMGSSPLGQIVTMQAARLYDCAEQSLSDLADSHALYYGGDPWPGGDAPTCRLTSPIAASLSGKLLYSGALWVHPGWRGQHLSAILPRISRVLGLGRWGTDFTFTFVSDQIAASKLFPLYGYHRIEPGYSIHSGEVTTYRGSLVWMNRDELVADMNDAVSRYLAPEIDGVIGDRSRQDDQSAA